MKRGNKAVAACLCMASTALGQGTLIPPGAPVPTMKTLGEIGVAIDGALSAAGASEPRTSLETVAGDGTYHHVITQPGSYYLNGNLEVEKTSGIKIDADAVSLDLNGFRIVRASGAGGAGIDILPGSKGIAVQNGSISGFSYGIFCQSTPYVEGCLFRNLSISDCSLAGLHAGRLSRIAGCRFQNNSRDGVFVSSDSLIDGCVVSGNGGNGIFAISGAIIKNCTVEDNEGTGSTSAGILSFGSLILDCTVRGNSHTNLAGTSAMGMGINAGSGSIVRGCNVSNNEGDGIRMESGSLAEGNTCARNGYNVGDGAGIHATGDGNRIDGNTVTDNDRGIDVDGIENFIVRNIATYSGTPYDIVATNRVGTIAVAPNSAAVSGSTGGAGTGSGDPWANFSF